MKKNILLFLILGMLIGFAYLIQERKVLANKEKSKFEVYQLIKEFDQSWQLASFKNMSLKNENSQLIVGPYDVKASPDSFELMVKFFREIKVTEEIFPAKIKDYKRDFFFMDPAPAMELTLADGSKIKYLFGKFSDLAGKFAVERQDAKGSRFYLCRNDNEMEGFFQNEIEMEQTKYANMVNWLMIPPIAMMEQKISSLWGITAIQKLLVQPAGNQREFTVDLVAKKTEPRIPKGIGFDEKKASELLTVLDEVRWSEYLPQAPLQSDSQMVQTLLLWKNDQQAVQLVLWKENNSGIYWIEYPVKGGALVLAPGAEKAMLLNLQYFWLKVIRPVKEYDGKVPLRFVLTKDKESTTLEIMDKDNKDLLSVTKGDKRWLDKEKNILLLIGMILDRDHRLADYVYPESYREFVSRSDTKGKIYFELELLGNKYTFIKNAKELLIYDKVHGLTFSYDWQAQSSWWNNFDL